MAYRLAVIQLIEIETPFIHGGIVTYVAVVVPFRGGCPHRERAWEYVRERYASTHPGWKVVEAPAPEGAWRKAAAVVPAIEASDAEIVIQADADCFTEGLADAVSAVEAGAGWAVPHGKVYRLSESATEAVLAGEDWRKAGRAPKGVVQRPYPGVLGGGFVVARRDILEACPLDFRFRAWGNEDEAHAIALNALYGRPWRGDAPLVHLFHPPQERMTRRRGSKESWALRNRYFRARNDPDAMRELLEEGRCLSPA